MIPISISQIRRFKFLTLSINTLLILYSLSSCKKLVEVNSPTTNIDEKNVYTNNETAASVLTGVYSQISGGSLTGYDLISIGFLAGLGADELTLYDGSADATLKTYYKNNISPSAITDIWTNVYYRVYVVNSAIEGLTNSTLLNPKVKQQLLGEAMFLRAFINFYLVNLYGDIPLVTSTDYRINSILSRTTSDKVWVQIITDLKEAQDLLTSNYLDATVLQTTTERVRPNKWAATALLARSYLYVRDWKNAELESSKIIDNSAIYSLEDSLKNVFLMNNREAIWQLQPVTYGLNTLDAKTYIITATGPSEINPVYLSDHLLKSFEDGDLRRNNWVSSIIVAGSTYYFPFKYKSATYKDPVTEYHTVLRLAEQYLIRSEARAQQDNVNGALQDLNLIRKRAGLNDYTYNSKPALISAILHERQVELFTEWGNRWLDLKRSKTIDAVMNAVTPQKGGKWTSNWQLYPIPASEIIADGNLTQNAGY